MIRPATKITLEVVAGLAAVTVVLVGVVAWRLAQGPLPVSFLTPIVTQAANDRLPDYSLEIADMVVVWASADGALELQAVDVSILGKEGRRVVNVPRMAVDFSLRAALAGRLVPKKLSFEGASLTLVRGIDGAMRFGLTNMPGEVALPAPEPTVSEEGSQLVSTLIEAVSAPRDEPAASADAGRYLEGLSIQNASVTVFDQRSGGLWLASDVGLEFRNTPLGLAGVINAHVLSPGGEWDLIGTVRAADDEEPVVISTKVNGIRLPDFARTMVALEPLAMLDSAMSGQVVARLDRQSLAIRDLAVNVTAGPGTLTLPLDEPAPFYPPKPLDFDGNPQPEDPRPPYTPQPWRYAIESARLSGQLLWPEGRVTLAELTVKGEAIDISLAGEGDVTVSPQGGIEDVRLAVKLAPSAINIPKVTTGIARIDGFDGTVRFSPQAGLLQIENAAVMLGEGYVSLAGMIEELADGGVGMVLDGNVENLLLSDLLQAWPPRVAHGAREWVSENVSGGLLDKGRLRIDAANGELEQSPPPDDAISMQMDFADVTLRYLGDLPPITDARGTMMLTGNSYTANLTGGQISPPNGGLVQISAGSFTTRDFHIRGSNAYIDVNAAGSMTSILSLLDQEPLGYPSGFGLDPRDVTGTATANLKVTLPMRSQLLFRDVMLNANGTVSNLVLPDIGEDISLNDGEMSFDVTNTGLKAQGKMSLAQTPITMVWAENFEARGRPSSTFEISGIFDNPARDRVGLEFGRNITGALPVRATLTGKGPQIATALFDLDLGPVTLTEPTINWVKEPGIPARLVGTYTEADDGSSTLTGLNLVGESVQLQADIFLNPEREITRATISRVQLSNGTDLTGTVQGIPEEGIMRFDFSGPVFDARDFLDGLFEDPEPVAADDEPIPVIIATANVDRVTAHGGEVVRNGKASLTMEQGRMQQLSVDGIFESGGALLIEMKPTTFQARAIRATSQNAGAVLRSLDLYENMQGGDIEFDARIDDRIEGSPLEGRLTGTNLRVRNAPVLANILTLGSLTGINDTLQGEGILFTRLDAPVRVNDKAIDLDDAIMSGPAIGATIKGHVNRETDVVDLGGTIVPAYTVNSFLGNIPVLGDLFVGREGEGLFGITYGISGKSDNPEVTVNPLAAFVPGIFRRIFEFGGQSSEDAADGKGSGPAQAGPEPTAQEPSAPEPTANIYPDAQPIAPDDDS
ncbi:AsmA-like C-terminal region-containing protein [Pyruvatibacter sp.]|uniref:YhdP family protein n=1 Tax=Pyruvatibacter sp. TaxID=1981328 RepID=UPI0032F06771